MRSIFKRLLCLTLAVLLAVLSFAACDGNSGSSSSDDDDDEREESKKPGKDEGDEEEEFTLPGTYVLIGINRNSSYFNRDRLALVSVIDLIYDSDDIDEKALQDLDNDMTVQFNKYKLILNEDHTGELDGIEFVWREDEDGITLYENEEAMANDEDPLRAVIDGSSLCLYTNPHEENFYEVFKHEEKVAPYEKYKGDYHGTYKSLYVFDDYNDIFCDRSDAERQVYENIGEIETAIGMADFYFDDIVLNYRENGEAVISAARPDGEKQDFTLEGEPGGRIFSLTDPDGDESYPVIFYRDYVIVSGICDLGLLVMTTKNIPEPEKWVWLGDDPEFDSHPAAKALDDYIGKLRSKDFDGLVQSMPKAVIKFAAKINNRGVSDEYVYLADKYEEWVGSNDIPEIKINSVLKLGSSQIEEMLNSGAEDDVDLEELWQISPYENFWKVGAVTEIDGEEGDASFVLIQIDGKMWVFDYVIFDF